MEYVHLGLGCPKIAMYVADCPRIILKILQEVAHEVAQEQYHALYEQNATQKVHVRISQLAVDDSIRDIRCGLHVYCIFTSVFTCISCLLQAQRCAGSLRAGTCQLLHAPCSESCIGVLSSPQSMPAAVVTDRIIA